MKNILITGADGFVGGWLAKALVDNKENVICIIRDLKNNNALDLHNIRDKVTVVQGDIRDYELLLRVLNEYQIEYVYHLAAQAIVNIAEHSPLSTFESNIKGTWTLLEACRIYGKAKGIIVASSDKAYGTSRVPYKEEYELKGRYPYDASKACADMIAQCYFITYNLPVAITRNANTYGYGDTNMSRIIPDAIDCAMTGRTLMIRSNGKSERDFLYVKDAVNAYMWLMGNIEELKGHAFNFGMGQPISVLDLIKEISEATGKDIKFSIKDISNNEIKRQYLDTTKAKDFGWEPKYTLKEGLKDMLQ